MKKGYCSTKKKAKGTKMGKRHKYGSRKRKS